MRILTNRMAYDLCAQVDTRDAKRAIRKWVGITRTGIESAFDSLHGEQSVDANAVRRIWSALH